VTAAILRATRIGPISGPRQFVIRLFLARWRVAGAARAIQTDNQAARSGNRPNTARRYCARMHHDTDNLLRAMYRLLARRGLKWWYWLAAAQPLGAALLGWTPGMALAFAAVAAQALHYFVRERSVRAFAVQVPVVYLGLLTLGLWQPLSILHALQLIGTWVRLLFDYCPLARTLLLAPWNRSGPLTWALVRRAYLTPPVEGSILAHVAANEATVRLRTVQ
jgi:hypothetical protein